MPPAESLLRLLSCARHNTTTDGGLNTVKPDSYGIMAPSHGDDTSALCRQFKHCSLLIIYKKVPKMNFSIQMWLLSPSYGFVWTPSVFHCHEYEKEKFVPPTEGKARTHHGSFSEWELGTFYLLWRDRSLNKQMDRLSSTHVHALTYKHTWSIIHAVGCP